MRANKPETVRATSGTALYRLDAGFQARCVAPYGVVRCWLDPPLPLPLAVSGHVASLPEGVALFR